MKKIFLFFGFCILTFALSAQTVSAKLAAVFNEFEKDSQLKHAISSLYVINAKTGEVMFDKNSQIGLAGASTQKIITATTAFELLGKDYRYKTDFGIQNNELIVEGSGDPTLGSWRWDHTNENNFVKRVQKALDNSGIKNLGDIFIDIRGWEVPAIPDGWIWQDIGNYYGAAAYKLNWRENQYDLILKSGKKIGDTVKIIGSIPSLYSQETLSYAVSAAKGTGDNAYIYFLTDKGLSPYSIVKGTIPINEDSFKVSGALISPEEILSKLLVDSLNNMFKSVRPFSSRLHYENSNERVKIICTEFSPSLDSIIYWFLKKSINLYGEALIKTFAYEKKGFGSTDTGVVIVKDFWKQKGLDENEINIVDGSGLSPLNRITTHAQVEILRYAKTKDWFPYFYDALPEYNGMKMKSGTINGVKGFCGYHTSKDGNEYIFSFLVNNYNGSSSALVEKMYRVLNVLK